jgi:hypothetical protein
VRGRLFGAGKSRGQRKRIFQQVMLPTELQTAYLREQSP